jgi:hypothetical protein
MKRTALTLFMLLLLAGNSRGQNSDLKFVADTLVVEAQGRYEADPDLATLTFSVFAQDRNLKQDVGSSETVDAEDRRRGREERFEERRPPSERAYRAALLGRG